MQVDFHFGCVYILARSAGFKPECAHIIAYSSEYVDDCKFRNTVIRLKKGRGTDPSASDSVYRPLSTAHKFISRENIKLENQIETLLPFHFIPGGGINTESGFIKRSVVKRDSVFARNLLLNAENYAGRPVGLYLLGTALHAYADTWAHEGFSAFLANTNNVYRCSPRLKSDRIVHRLTRQGRWGKLSRNIIKLLFRRYIAETFTVGHFEASRRPDIPWIEWEYINEDGERVLRKNPDIFLEAARLIFAYLKDYLAANPQYRDTGLKAREWFQIEDEIRLLLFTGRNAQEEDGERRLGTWLDRTKDGAFGFRDFFAAYRPNEWFSEAVEYRRGSYTARPNFERSRWFLFQEAAKIQRAYVLKHFVGGLFAERHHEDTLTQPAVSLRDAV